MPAQKRYRPEDPAAAVKELYDAVKRVPMARVYVGIDPGNTGAIAFMPTTRKVAPVVLDMPIMTNEVKSKVKGKAKTVTRTTYNYWTIAKLFDPAIDNVDITTIALERGQPMGKRPGGFPGAAERVGDTVRTGFAIGMGYGMWQLFFAAFGLQWEELMPAVWKKQMGLTKQQKDASRGLAMKLFPKGAVYFEMKSDHNRAEAALLAEYLRRKHAGG